MYRRVGGDAGGQDLVETEEEHCLEPRIQATPGPGEKAREHMAKGWQAPDHPGSELARERALARPGRGVEASGEGVGEGARAVQVLAEDGEGGVPAAAARPSGRLGVGLGAVHPGSEVRTGPLPRRCPGARLRPFRNSRASIGRFPGR